MSNGLTVAFRADASQRLGAGHVMRCLTLAAGLAARGGRSTFISQTLPPSLASRIRAAGHELREFDSAVTEESDAWQSREWLSDGVEWLVVDHYGLGREWELAMRGCARRVLVIDDLADRNHDCDLLLDQNFHREPEARYAGRLPAGCRQLFGPRYSLLRGEFRQAREKVQPRSGEVNRVLVFFGGMDVANTTTTALQALARLPAVPSVVDVVVGAEHQQLSSIRALCATQGFTLHVQSSRMAELMASADASLGAGGSTTWERCCLGVPSFIVVVADNQRELAREAGAAGLVFAPDPDGEPAIQFGLHLEGFLADAAGLRNMSARCLQLVDGRGVARVLRAMGVHDIGMRLARREDARNLFEWRNAPEIRAMSRTRDPIAWEAHVSWMDRVLVDDNRHLLIGERQGLPVGVVRFDIQGDSAEVSVYKVPGQEAQGRGSDLLAAAESWLGQHCPSVRSLRAEVRGDNAASHRLFLAAGYKAGVTAYCKRMS